MARAMRIAALCLPFAAAVSLDSHEDLIAESALAADAQCADDGNSSEHCALNAMQLRTRKTQVDAEGSCHSYGCGAFVKSQACQCNAKCHKYSNCCSDFAAHCAAASSGGSGGSCSSYGCGGFDKGQSCQCNAKCHKYGNCCHDFGSQCHGGGGHGGSSSHGGHGGHGGAMAMPSGVNFGGWLVLEDWFFSGTKGRHVMTTGTVGQGRCLPPLLKSEGETWPSEGVLTKRLENSHGPSGAIKIFDAHRAAYISDKDFAQIASLGVREVRVPIPWTAFADALSSLDPEAYGSGNKIVPDPYYHKEASFVVVDRDLLKGVLRKASAHGLKVFLDMHTMPGGASDATYSGIWPNPPKFWNGNVQIGHSKMPLEKAGYMIVKAFISWVEHLGPERGTVAGLTLLNEPAHMSHIDLGKGKPFVHSEKQVMNWMASASDMFRKSSLPKSGVKLHVSIIESAFRYFWDTAPAWYSKTFSHQERYSWAIFDIHFYDAWTPKCSGRITKGGGYNCNQPISEIKSLIDECHQHYMSLFSKKVDGLKACTEFSVATFEDPVLACNDDKLLKMYLSEQVKVFKKFKIDAFFWTWRMPHGKNFEKAWSLKHLAGLEGPAEDSC